MSEEQEIKRLKKELDRIHEQLNEEKVDHMFFVVDGDEAIEMSTMKPSSLFRFLSFMIDEQISDIVMPMIQVAILKKEIIQILKRHGQEVDSKKFLGLR